MLVESMQPTVRKQGNILRPHWALFLAYENTQRHEAGVCPQILDEEIDGNDWHHLCTTSL